MFAREAVDRHKQPLSPTGARDNTVSEASNRVMTGGDVRRYPDLHLAHPRCLRVLSEDTVGANDGDQVPNQADVPAHLWVNLSRVSTLSAMRACSNDDTRAGVSPVMTLADKINIVAGVPNSNSKKRHRCWYTA